MKKIFILALCLILVFPFTGCGKEKQAGIANPWTDWDSLKEAEKAVGYSFGMPETIEDTYIATGFRTLAGDTPMIEVTYTDPDCTVVVRKSPGEGRDISGIYGYDDSEQGEWWNGEQISYYRSAKDAASLKILIDHDGYSWSLYAPNGFWGGSFDGFGRAVFE